jgi:hypothetical protein
MQRTILNPSLVSSETGPNPNFNVVIAYEDFETGKHAKETYDFLLNHLGADCKFSNQMWKFDVLTIPKLRDIAVHDALSADIIVISSRGGDLPAAVKSWIEGWAGQSGNAIALVALFENPEEDSAGTARTQELLAAVARRSNLEFFAQPEKRAGTVPEVTLTHGELGERTLSTLAGAMQQDVTFPRWGINE